MKFNRTQLPYQGLMLSQPHLKAIRPLDKDEAAFLVSLTLKAEPVTPEEFHEFIADHFVGQIMTKRMAYYGVDIFQVAVPEAMLFVLALSENDRPGSAVMWAYTLMLLSAELGQPVDLRELCKRFPMGVPDLDSMRACWDMQKCSEEERKERPGGDNKLDWPDWWQVLATEIKKHSPRPSPVPGGNAVEHEATDTVQLSPKG